MADKVSHGLQRENLATRDGQQAPHVFPAHLEAAPREAGHDLITRPAVTVARIGHEIDNTRHLIARRTGILGELGLDDHFWVVNIWDDEIGCLIERNCSPHPGKCLPGLGC